MGVFVFELNASLHRLQFDCIYDLRGCSSMPGISGAFSLYSRKEYKSTALVTK